MNDRYGMPPLPNLPEGHQPSGQGPQPEPAWQQYPGHPHPAPAPAEGSAQPSYGVPNYGAPAYGQSQQLGGHLQNAQTRQNQRKPWFIALAVVLPLLLIGGLVWGGIALFGKKAGADTPEAAAEDFLKSVASLKFTELGSTIAPAESEMLMRPLERLAFNSGSEAGGVKLRDALVSLQESVDINIEELKMEPMGPGEDARAMIVYKARVKIDGDEDKFKAALGDIGYSVSYEIAQLTGASESSAHRSAEATADSIRKQFNEDFPMVRDLTEDGPFTLVSVKEDGRWYVSPVLTAAQSQVGSLSTSEPVRIQDPGSDPATSPEEAGKQFVAQLVGSMQTGNATLDLAETLTRPERLLLGLVESATPLEKSPYANTTSVDGGFEVENRGDFTIIRPKNLRVSAGSGTITLDKDCFDNGHGRPSCLSDIKLAKALNLHTIGLVVKEEDGGWLVSPYGTVAYALDTAVSAYIELRDAGRLHELQL